MRIATLEVSDPEPILEARRAELQPGSTVALENAARDYIMRHLRKVFGKHYAEAEADTEEQAAKVQAEADRIARNFAFPRCDSDDVVERHAHGLALAHVKEDLKRAGKRVADHTHVELNIMAENVLLRRPGMVEEAREQVRVANSFFEEFGSG